ncbi:MAG: zinc ribbon domain-containing protein [Halanaeroarchaeum sp.]
MQTSLLRRRPLIAGLFALIYPGLGHFYLRAWVRGVAWFALAMVTAALVVPQSVVAAFERGGIDALLAATQSLPLRVTGSLLVVRALNVLDAYLTGLRRESGRAGGREESAPTCPNCGRELDEDLDFCPWCTTELSEFEGTEGDDEEEREGLPFP